MKYPEEILRERLESLQAEYETLQHNFYLLQDKFNDTLGDLKGELWRLRRNLDERISDLIENVEDAERD